MESVSKKGYELISSPDILRYEEIKEFLDTKYTGKETIHFDSIDSLKSENINGQLVYRRIFSKDYSI